MARRADPTRETTPKHFAEVPPTTYPEAVGTTFVVESLMQIQKSIGELQSTVNHLKTSVDSHGSKIDSISHRVYAAGAVIAVLLGIGGWLLNKIWDKLISVVALPPPPV